MPNIDTSYINTFNITEAEVINTEFHGNKQP